MCWCVTGWWIGGGGFRLEGGLSEVDVVVSWSDSGRSSSKGSGELVPWKAEVCVAGVARGGDRTVWVVPRDEQMLTWFSIVRIANVQTVRWVLGALNGWSSPVSSRQAQSWCSRMRTAGLIETAQMGGAGGAVVWATYAGVRPAKPDLYRQTTRHEIAEVPMAASSSCFKTQAADTASTCSRATVRSSPLRVVQDPCVGRSGSAGTRLTHRSSTAPGRMHLTGIRTTGCPGLELPWEGRGQVVRDLLDPSELVDLGLPRITLAILTPSLGGVLH